MSGSRVPKIDFPLSGKRVILTQSSEQCEKLEKMLYVEQAVVIKIPTIDFKLVNHLEQIERAVNQLEQYDLLVLTSQNSFHFFFGLIKQMNVKLPSKLKIAVVGEETMKVVQQNGYLRWGRARLLKIEQYTGVGLLCVLVVRLLWMR